LSTDKCSSDTCSHPKVKKIPDTNLGTVGMVWNDVNTI